MHARMHTHTQPSEGRARATLQVTQDILESLLTSDLRIGDIECF